MKHSRARVGGHLGRATGPVGVVTRGTTAPGRLRRMDRWTVHRPRIRRLLNSVERPLAVDLGYGASTVTTLQWARALRSAAPAVRVVGLEIDPARVPAEPPPGAEFHVGGFELAGLHPHVVRAVNVLRQYSEAEVAATWELVAGRLAPGGVLVEGTCDELGRHCSWVEVDARGPRTLTLAWSPRHTRSPSQVAARLPKALIHRNVPGERVHALLADADRAWEATAGLAAYGPGYRWRSAHGRLIRAGWPLERLRGGGPDSLLTLPWQAVAPGDHVAPRLV